MACNSWNLWTQNQILRQNQVNTQKLYQKNIKTKPNLDMTFQSLAHSQVPQNQSHTLQIAATFQSYNIFGKLQREQMEKKSKQTINYVSKLDKQVFNQDLTNQFACQCGKIYWTFPALYLHFQRSHKIKISTKVNEECCEINKTGNVRTFTYFFSKDKQKSAEEKEKQGSLTKLFSQFASSLENQWDRYPALYLCSSLQKYLHEQETFTAILYETARISSIPSYFNAFMLENKAMMKTDEIYNFNCNYLLILSKWLNFKGYSNLKLEYSETSAKIQFDFASASRSSDSI